MIIIIAIISALFENLFLSLFVPLPFNDTGEIRYKSYPWGTTLIILINCAVFIWWQAPDIMLMDYGNEQEYYQGFWGYIEKAYTYGAQRNLVIYQEGIGAFSTFTGIFMHGSFRHLISNMIFLWAFGRRVEDACGTWRFILFYLFVGTMSTMGNNIIITEDPGTSIGASGAVSGLMGAYMFLFTGTRIGCLWPSLSILRIVPVTILRWIGIKRFSRKFLVNIPAFIVLILYVGSDIFSTIESAQTRNMPGHIDYVAHGAGFLSAITIFLFVRKDLFMRYVSGRKL